MIILLIAEARSGSTNLAKWLKESLPSFKLLNEPYNKKSNNFIGNGEIDVTVDSIISEKYFNNEGLLNKLINISDVTFCLNRTDIKLQLESYMTALSTDNWYSEYTNIINDASLSDKMDEFINNKINFQRYIETNSLKLFTYEDLYYENKIYELKQFLNIETDIPFPYGKKYRTDITNKKIF